MTTREIEARRYIRRCRQRRRAQKARRQRIMLLGAILCFVFLWLSACHIDKQMAATTPDVKTPAITTPTEEPVYYDEVTDPTFTGYPEIVHTVRDDIVSDGRLLSYDLQEIMQDYCKEYGVPYALALAIAEVETHFDPDAVSRTGDYGLMQINTCNHEWLAEKGIDVLTHESNIEGGIYIISQHLEQYGEPELALMAYNCGPTGAKQLWDAGTFQTDYSRKVMTAFEYWTSVLEG